MSIENFDAIKVASNAQVGSLTVGTQNPPNLKIANSLASIGLTGDCKAITFQAKRTGTESKPPTVVHIDEPLPLVLQPDGGSVGIGTETPSAKLEVRGDDRGQSDVLVTGRFKSVSSHGGGLFVDASETCFVGSDLRGGIGFNNKGWRLTVMPTGNVGLGTNDPQARLDVGGGDIQWGNHSWLGADQGGSIELGGDRSTPGKGTPYIDFHFQGLKQDFNSRIINDDDGRLSVFANTLRVSGKLEIGGDVRVNDKTIWLRGGTDPNHGLGYWATNTFAGDNPDGPVLFGYAGGALGTTDGGRKVALTWNQAGNVEVTGDIILKNADVAEDFDIAEAEAIEPGTVMVIDREGALRQSEQAYDKRVAGVISGAGSLRPGITLDKQHEEPGRLPLALTGKVYCKVDAQYGPVQVGDLLTTSPTSGHAMKAGDQAKAFGAIIGKALRELAAGQGLIPILVALQ